MNPNGRFSFDKSRGKPQLHVSALNMLSTCGEQFRRRYIEGEKIPPGIYALVGRSVDNTVSLDMIKKRDTGELLSDEEIGDIARDTFTHELDTEGVRLEPDEADIPLEKIEGAGVDRSVRLARLHHTDLAPKLTPRHIKRKFVIDMKDFPVDLAGELDLETVETYGDVEKSSYEAIRDTKTRKASPPKDAADRSEQLTMYAMAKKVIDGYMPSEVILDCLVDTVKPKVVSVASTRTVDDLRPLIARVLTAVKAIESGIFVPAKQSDPLCSPKYCGYFNTCPYVVRRPTSVTVAGIEVSADAGVELLDAPTLERKLQASIDEARARRGETTLTTP